MQAQVSSYAFSTGTTGVLDPMTASTQLVGTNSDDGASPVTAIGFTFNFAGTDYTQFSVNANGNLRLGATAVSTAWTNSVINVAATSPAIMPYWDDLATGSNGKVHYVLTGTAPDRKLIVEWFVTIPRNTVGIATAKFQCVLEETTNKITFVYGSGLVPNTGFSGSTIGIATSASLFNTVNATTNTNSASTFIIDNLVAISEGRTYTFTPPTCPGSTGLASATNITNSGATVTWIEPSTVPSNGYEYVVSSSAIPPSGTGTASATNSAVVTSLMANTVYYVYVRSICGTDIGTWVSVGTFKTLCNEVTDFNETFDSYTAGFGVLPNCWSIAGTSPDAYILGGSVAPMSPTNRFSMTINATTTLFVKMPPLANLQLATHRLRFKAFATAENKTLQLGYFTNASDLSTFVQLQSFALPGTTATAAQEFTYNVPALPAGVNQLVFTIPSGSFTSIYIDDVKWEFNSPCIEPSQVISNLITNNSAQITWLAGGATAWEIQYGPLNFQLGSGTMVTPINTNPYTLTGLMPNTTYHYYVRGVCEGPINSSWAGPFTFKTQCDEVTEYTQNFDSLTTNFINTMPDCWSRGLIGSPSIYVTNASVAPMSPINRLYMFASAGGTIPSEAFAILPPVSNLQAGTHRLRFKAYATVAGRTVQIGYLSDVTNLASFALLQEISLPGNLATSATEFFIIPGTIPAGVKHLAIRNNGFTGTPLGSTTAYFDDFKWEAIPTCIEPEGLTVSNITNSSATLGWTEANAATAWEIEYGAPGFVQGSAAGTIVSATSNPFVLSGLAPNTNYVYYVRSVCSTTDSSYWTGPLAFKTQCNDVMTFSENFDTYPSSGVNNLPDCWSRGGNSLSTYITSGGGLPGTAPNRLYMFASGTAVPPTEAFAILPSVSNLNAGTHRLRFKAYATAVDRFLEIGYLTDPSDVSTFVYITDIQLPGTSITSAQQFVVLPPTTIPTGVKNLTIKNPGFPGASTTAYIDDVFWEAIPSCLEPTSVVMGSVLATSAVVNWTAPSTVPSGGYEFYYSTVNTAPDASTVATGSVAAGITTANLTSLTPITTYYVWVRSVCSSSDKSAWTVVVSFTTPCASFVPDYLENFSTFTFSAPPACWNKYGSGNLTTGPTGATNLGAWTTDGYLNNGTTGAAKINIWTTGVVGWLVSPVFDLSAGGYQVKYKVGVTQYNTTGPISQGAMGSDDIVAVLMSVDGGATWTNLTTYNAANTPSNLGTTATFAIPTVTSNAVKFAFYGTSGTVSEGQDMDFFIDDFEILTVPAAAPDCAINVTAVPNATCGNEATTISWNATANADGYKLTIGSTAGGSDILNNQLISGLTYSYIGASGTTYYYKVVPYNSTGEASGCIEQSFTTAATGCYCPSLPTSVDGTGVTQIVLGTSTYPISWTVAPFYQNNTTTIVAFEQNVLANVQITFNTSTFNYNTYIWIDFNDNFAFETSELVYSGVSGTTSPNTLNASFTMPSSATLGNHRMRIVAADVMSVGNPCYSSTYGVALDYTVNVIEQDLNTGGFDTTSFKYYPNPVTDMLIVSYGDVITEVVVFNLLGQQVLTAQPNAAQTQINLSGLTAGTYLVKVTSEEVTKTIKVVKN